MIVVDLLVLVELFSNGLQVDVVEVIFWQSLVGGCVVVCGVIFVEVCVLLCGGVEVFEVLEEMGVYFNLMEVKLVLCVGEMYCCYCQCGGSCCSLDEFMVGVYVLLQCDGLIIWNDMFYCDYFKGLKLIVLYV